MTAFFFAHEIENIQKTVGIQFQLSASIKELLKNLEKELIDNPPPDIPNVQHHTASSYSHSSFVSANAAAEYLGKQTHNYRNNANNYPENNFHNRRKIPPNSNHTTHTTHGKNTNGGGGGGGTTEKEIDFNKRVKLPPVPPPPPPFVPTKKDTVLGIDATIKEFRILLNKLSDNNYKTQSEKIIHDLATFIGGEPVVPGTDQYKLCETIFNAVSTTKFLSTINSKLYGELIKQFPIFNTILFENIQIFNKKIDEQTQYVDADKDYDGYCNYVKNNDKRKSMTLFIVNLVKLNILDVSYLFTILNHFLSKSLEYIDMENRTNEIEDIADNIHVVVSNLHLCTIKMSKGENTDITNLPEWINDIYPQIINISQMKIKEHPSITKRVIFKYMDIIDLL